MVVANAYKILLHRNFRWKAMYEYLEFAKITVSGYILGSNSEISNV